MVVNIFTIFHHPTVNRFPITSKWCNLSDFERFLIFIHFRFVFLEFSFTLILAYMSNSLVRVSRRDNSLGTYRSSFSIFDSFQRSYHRINFETIQFESLFKLFTFKYFHFERFNASNVNPWI